MRTRSFAPSWRWSALAVGLLRLPLDRLTLTSNYRRLFSEKIEPCGASKLPAPLEIRTVLEFTTTITLIA